MKSVILIIGTIIFLVNGLFGLLISGYEFFNLCFTSSVIFITTLLLYLLFSLKIKDGFIAGLGFLFILVGTLAYILGLISSPELQNNACVIITIILVAIEVMMLVVCRVTSKKIK